MICEISRSLVTTLCLLCRLSRCTFVLTFQFGNADSLVSKKTLEENYNVKFSYEDLENEEEKVYEEFGVTKDDCLGAFFFNKMEGLMFEYEWVNEEVAADIGKIISSN